jgi:drug/metabolite transporter (DMT)-like permease
VAMKLNTINTISFIEYLSLVYGYIIGVIFFGEALKITDLIGCGIIVGYSAFSIINPLVVSGSKEIVNP